MYTVHMDKNKDRLFIIIPGFIEGKIRNIIDDETLGAAFIICADSGYDRAKSESIVPDMIVGDFDSSETVLPEDIPVVTVPSHKDETDFELACSIAMENGAKEVLIPGGFGGRIDHTIGNIQNAAGFFEKGVTITMRDERNSLRVMKEGTLVIPREDAYLSLLAYSGPAVISISGVEYPLERHRITPLHPLGVSNEFTADEAVVTVHEGTILVMTAK